MEGPKTFFATPAVFANRFVSLSEDERDVLEYSSCDEVSN